MMAAKKHTFCLRPVYHAGGSGHRPSTRATIVSADPRRVLVKDSLKVETVDASLDHLCHGDNQDQLQAVQPKQRHLTRRQPAPLPGSAIRPLTRLDRGAAEGRTA